jgi:nucleoside-diphosphate-sugar epimerase
MTPTCTDGAPSATRAPSSGGRDHQGPLRDVEVADLEGVDAVCHLAALSNDPLGNLDPRLTYDINWRASVRLADCARQAGVERWIFSSSCSNYGAAGGQALLDEDAQLHPVTAYGESKGFTERDVSALATDDFSPTYLRNATAHGVSPRLRFDVVLNNLTAWVYTTGRVLLKSDGSPWRPLVHIEDIARVFFLARPRRARERVHDQAFNIGSTDENYQMRQLAEIVGQTVPTASRVRASASPDIRNYCVSYDKATDLLGFCTTWTAREGAKELYLAYQQVGVDLAEFEGSRYQRLAHIKRLLEDGLLDADLRVQPRAEEPTPPQPVKSG